MFFFTFDKMNIFNNIFHVFLESVSNVKYLIRQGTFILNPMLFCSHFLWFWDNVMKMALMVETPWQSLDLHTVAKVCTRLLAPTTGLVFTVLFCFLMGFLKSSWSGYSSGLYLLWSPYQTTADLVKGESSSFITDPEEVGHFVWPRGPGCCWPLICLIIFFRDSDFKDIGSLRHISSQFNFPSFSKPCSYHSCCHNDGLLVCIKISHNIQSFKVQKPVLLIISDTLSLFEFLQNSVFYKQLRYFCPFFIVPRFGFFWLPFSAL